MEEVKKTDLKIYNVRECGYNPQENIISVTSLDGSGSKQPYLRVEERMAWFLQYCKEHNVEGIIDESEVIYIPEAQMFKAIAKIMIEGRLIATGVGGVFYAPGANCTENPVQLAATIAKRRALANAGFGTKLSATEDDEPLNEAEKWNNPLIPNRNPNSEEKTKPTTARKPAIPTTVEEARLVQLVSGEYKGKLLGDIPALNMNYLSFLATKYTGPHPEYKAGAQLLLESTT